MSSIKQKLIGEIVLTTGTTVNIDSGDVSAPPYSVADSATIYRVTGTQTLSAANFAITISGASGPTKNTQILILWEAVATVGAFGNNVVISGATVPDELVVGNFTALCTYNGSAWVVNINPDYEVAAIISAARLGSDSVTTPKIIDDAVTLAKMAGLAKGTIIYGNASGNPTASAAGTDGQVWIADTSTGGLFATLSGVITMTKAGLTAFAAGAVTDAAVTSVAGGKITGDDTIASRKLSDTGILASGFADVGTAADTVKVTALTGSIALGTLDDGDKVVLECQIDAANTATVKTVRLEVDGNAITMNPVTTSPQNVNMIFRVTIQRASNTSALVYGTMVNGVVAETITSKPAITNFDTTAVPILVTIQNGTANANDLIFKGGSFTEFRG